LARSPDREVDFLLIGGGMAGASCAAELRKRGAEGSIVLVGREPEPPYERPPLSKEYLRGEAERADAYVNPPEWYGENEVELLSGRNVMSLDPAARTATIQGGEEVAFGQALIATGASALSKQVLGFGGISFWKVLFGVVATLLEWFKDDAVKDCPSPASDWCEAVINGDGKEIYEPLARYNAKRLLQDRGKFSGIALEKIKFIYGFIRKVTIFFFIPNGKVSLIMNIPNY